MNNGIVTPGYGAVRMPSGLLGNPSPVTTPENAFAFDADAIDYINRVEKADGAQLECGVRSAISRFVTGCKVDGTWSSIKACCILVGARTLSGALTPLVGSSPTNNNFVSGDYNRRFGLTSDGATKYIDTGRSISADPQNDCHLAAYFSSGAFIAGFVGVDLTGATVLVAGTATTSARMRQTTFRAAPNAYTLKGFVGLSRPSSTWYSVVGEAGAEQIAQDSVAYTALRNYWVQRWDPTNYRAGSVVFYSLGSSIDLVLLKARVSDLYASIGNAVR